MAVTSQILFIMNNLSNPKPSTGGILKKSTARQSKHENKKVSWGQFQTRLVGTDTDYH